MSKLNEYKEVNRDLINFLNANDNYIDSLELSIECLEAMTEELDKENDSLTEYTEELEDEMGEMSKYIEGLEFQLEQANAELIANKVAATKDFTDTMIAGQERKEYLGSFVDKKVVMSEEEMDEAVDYAIQKGIKRRKKLCFMQFKEMFKKNPNIKNHVAAKELGVTLETIVKLKCLLAG